MAVYVDILASYLEDEDPETRARRGWRVSASASLFGGTNLILQWIMDGGELTVGECCDALRHLVPALEERKWLRQSPAAIILWKNRQRKIFIKTEFQQGEKVLFQNQHPLEFSGQFYPQKPLRPVDVKLAFGKAFTYVRANPASARVPADWESQKVRGTVNFEMEMNPAGRYAHGDYTFGDVKQILTLIRSFYEKEAACGELFGEFYLNGEEVGWLECRVNIYKLIHPESGTNAQNMTSNSRSIEILEQ